MGRLKTTELTANDPRAEHTLRALIASQKGVLLVVLGSGAEAQSFVDRASAKAGAETDPFWVVWVQDAAGVQSILTGLQGQPLGDILQLRGFTLSRSGRVVGTFPISRAVPDELRILSAFMKAAAAT